MDRLASVSAASPRDDRILPATRALAVVISPFLVPADAPRCRIV